MMAAAPASPSPLLTFDDDRIKRIADALPASYDRELFLRCHAHMKQRRLTIQGFADETKAASRPTMSNYVWGKLDNPVEVQAALRAYFARIDRHAESGENYAATEVTRRVIAACREAFEDRKMVAISGAPSMGKTTGLKRFLQMAPGKFLVFSAYRKVTRVAVLRDLASQLGKSHCGTADVLLTTLKRVLDESSRAERRPAGP